MPYKKIFSLAIIAIFIISPFAIFASEFNPNYIISDFDYEDSDCMGLDEIQHFLEMKGSGLATYKTKDVDGKIKKAAKIIYRSANDYKISPKFILVMLQKEQSLIETANPTDYQLDWAMGFARCDDPVACSPEAMVKYKGFAIQVDRGAWRNRFYIENSHKLWLKQINSTYSIDGYNITPVNQATASLYNYTPHYHGNHNFWKIWNRYFSKNYPDGSLLKAEDSTNIYLITHGTRRKFANMASFSSRGYEENKIITASFSDISKYKNGMEIKFPNYSLIRSPLKMIYLLIDDKKHKIASLEVFKKIGYIADEIIDLPANEINEYPNGSPITMDSIYPLGALLRNDKTGGVYYVENSQKHPIWSKEILKTHYPNKKIIETDAVELDKIKDGGPIKFNDGELVKAIGHPAVYVISNGQRRPIQSGKIFEELGYSWDNIIEEDEKVLNILHPIGEIIEALQIEKDKNTELEEGTLVKSKTSPMVYLIADKILRPILSEEIFENLGFEWDKIKNISAEILDLYTVGEAIGENYNSKLAKAIN